MIWIIGIILSFTFPFIGIPIILYALFQLFSDDTASDSSNNESGMGSIKFRLNDIKLGDNGDGPSAKEVQAKGLIPLRKTTRVGFVTSVLDITTDDTQPILSSIDSFQEPSSTIYQNIMDYGDIPINQGFPEWARVGVVIPEILQTPYSGYRKILVLIRMVDLDNLPTIQYGFCQTEQNGLIWQDEIEFSVNFTDKGYKEEEEHHDESIAIAVKIGVAVAYIDGKIEESELSVLKKWVTRNIERYSDEKKIELKSLYSNAIKEAYSSAKNGNLSLSVLTSRLNEIGSKSDKYETIELCFDIMAADGIADAKELKIIRKVAESLNLDVDEINKIHDTKIVCLNSSHLSHATVEVILGIEPHWDHDKIKKYLRDEFQKWNNRLNTLQEGTERENAQRMIDNIAEARKKYA